MKFDIWDMVGICIIGLFAGVFFVSIMLPTFKEGFEDIKEKINVEEIEVCNCGYVRTYNDGTIGGMYGAKHYSEERPFSRNTPVEICEKLLEGIREESLKNKDIVVGLDTNCNDKRFITQNRDYRKGGEKE